MVLRPGKDVVAERDAERRARTGKFAYRPGEYTIDGLDAALAGTPRIGLWIDTSDQTPEETVGEIMLRATEATIG